MARFPQPHTNTAGASTMTATTSSSAPNIKVKSEDFAAACRNANFGLLPLHKRLLVALLVLVAVASSSNAPDSSESTFKTSLSSTYTSQQKLLEPLTKMSVSDGSTVSIQSNTELKTVGGFSDRFRAYIMENTCVLDKPVCNDSNEAEQDKTGAALISPKRSSKPDNGFYCTDSDFDSSSASNSSDSTTPDDSDSENEENGNSFTLRQLSISILDSSSVFDIVKGIISLFNIINNKYFLSYKQVSAHIADAKTIDYLDQFLPLLEITSIKSIAFDPSYNMICTSPSGTVTMDITDLLFYLKRYDFWLCALKNHDATARLTDFPISRRLCVPNENDVAGAVAEISQYINDFSSYYANLEDTLFYIFTKMSKLSRAANSFFVLMQEELATLKSQVHMYKHDDDSDTE